MRAARLAVFVLPLVLTFPLVGADCGGSPPTAVDSTGGDGAYATIETFAGTGWNAVSPDGLDPLHTDFSLPQDVTFGPDDLPYILDWNNHRVRTIRGGVIVTIIGTGELGDALEGPGTDTALNHPTNVAFDLQGNLILAAWRNSKVMRWIPPTGMLERVCGDGHLSYGGDGGPAIDAVLDLPVSTVVDKLGRIYITDQANNRIRRIDLDGTIHTIAGNGTLGFSGDGGPAAQAEIALPSGEAALPVGRIALASNGDLYFADYGNNRIRRIRSVGGVDIIETVVGDGRYSYRGDGGPATAASLRGPSDVALDADDNLFIADTFNGCIRKVDSGGIITTFAGTPEQFGFDGDGGPPTAALLDHAYGIAFNAEGDLFIADTYNQRIRVIRR